MAHELCRRGCALLDEHRFEEARVLLRRAQSLVPRDSYVLYCLALLHGDVGERKEALAALDASLAIDPTNSKAHNNRGSILQQLGRLPEAEAAYRTARNLAPGLEPPYVNLGNVLEQQGRAREALAVYDEALGRGLDPDLFGQIRATVLGKSTTRSPDSWVKSTFDNFATIFDSHLQTLGYDIPAKLAALTHARRRDALDVLDLGCGTGQVGVALAGHGHRIVGVDLSERMLARARARGIYASLHAEEIHEFLISCNARSFDAVCAADVFIYIGVLEGLFAHVARVLRVGGCFAFSIEETAGNSYRLLPTGRYAQSDTYIRSLAVVGFNVIDAASTTIRMERGQAIDGRVYLLERSNAP